MSFHEAQVTAKQYIMDIQTYSRTFNTTIDFGSEHLAWMHAIANDWCKFDKCYETCPCANICHKNLKHQRIVGRKMEGSSVAR